MRYAIHTIDNSRARYIENIEEKLQSWWQCNTWCVDARESENIRYARKIHPYDINWKPDVLRSGHLGIWYTVLNSLKYAPVVTFEDDAILHSNFVDEFNKRVNNLPKDFDFFSLFIPRDHDQEFYLRSQEIYGAVTKVWQRYGGVSMYYSKRGAHKIETLLLRDGITDQYDNTLYAYAKAGELNGYVSTPDLDDLVKISGNEESIVQTSNILEDK